MKIPFHSALLSYFFTIIGVSQLMAAQIDWANTSTDFNLNTAWSGSVLPGTSDAAVFNAATTFQPNLTSNISVAQLVFNTATASGTTVTADPGVSLTLTSNLNPAGNIAGAGAALLAANNGTYTVDANLILTGSNNPNVTAAISTSTLIINGNLTTTGASGSIRNNAAGTVEFNGVVSGALGFNKISAGTSYLNNVANTYSSFTTAGGGVLEIKTLANGGVASSVGNSSNDANNLRLGTFNNGGAGILRYTGTGDSTDRLFRLESTGSSLESSGTGALNFTNTGDITTSITDVTKGTLILGGTNTGDNTLAARLATGNIGGLTKEGVGKWILTGNHTYLGGTAVNAGTLIINGDQSLATGAVTVASGATLGGSGTIGGSTTVNGTLAPGNSPGLLTFSDDLTLTSTATTVMEIGSDATRGTTFDAINVAGALNYDGTLSLIMTTTYTDGVYSWNLFDFASETGGFASVALSGTYAGSLTDAGGGNWGLVSGDNTWSFTESTGVLGLTVIPEPSTWALLAGGLIVLTIFRRRRKC